MRHKIHHKPSLYVPEEKSRFNEFKKWFLSIPKDTQEYQNVFELVNESYFTKPEKDQDDNFKVSKTLNMLACRGDFELKIATMKIAEQVFQCTHNKIEAVHGVICPNDVEYHFDIYTNKSALSNLEKMLRNTVMMKVENGDLK